MVCKFDEMLLYSFVDNTIEPLEKIFVEEHLKYCTHCKKELEEIYLFDEKLEKIDFDIPIPERLSVLSKLVLENCISGKEYNSEKLYYKKYLIHMESVRQVVKYSKRAGFNNPYTRFIEDKINKVKYKITSSTKEYCKVKFSGNKIFKILKVV